MQRIITFILALIGLITLLVMYVDQPLNLYIQGLHQTNPAFIKFFQSYTELGLGGVYLIPSGIIAIACFILSRIPFVVDSWRKIFAKGEYIFGYFFVTFVVASIITTVLKYTLARGRPHYAYETDLDGFHPLAIIHRGWQDYPSGWNSFPSGHTTIAFAFGMGVAMMWPRFRTTALFYAFALGLSRIMVNAHFLSDTIMGAVVGSFSAIMVWRWFAQRRWVK